jgi:glutamate 5-kinase
MQSKSRRVVIKFGTGILTKSTGVGLDEDQFARLVHGVAGLRTSGYQPILVSSGAVGAGSMALGLTQRPTETATLQACAAIGQTRLMHLYDKLFRDHGLITAQLLLTNEDFGQAIRRQNLSNTLTRLLECGNVIPIINENDSVATEELKVGDNDQLSASVAIVCEAGQLFLLTSADGLEAEGKMLERVDDIDAALQHVRGDKGSLSVGGMASKLEAVRRATEAGIETLIANGRYPEQLSELALGRGRGTRFTAKK